LGLKAENRIYTGMSISHMHTHQHHKGADDWKASSWEASELFGSQTITEFWKDLKMHRFKIPPVVKAQQEPEKLPDHLITPQNWLSSNWFMNFLKVSTSIYKVYKSSATPAQYTT